MTQSMHGLQPLLAFAETAKRGNFAAASREIGCTPSTLAKAVSRLEARLGIRLFHRTTRQVTLTDDGQRLFARCQRVLTELELLQEDATGARDEPAGTLRIDMPVTFGRLVMLPLLARLVQQYPRLSIDARFSDAYVDLVKEGIDVAIRTGTLRDSSLVARTFSSQELLLFAAPGYLARWHADHGRRIGAPHRGALSGAEHRQRPSVALPRARPQRDLHAAVARARGRRRRDRARRGPRHGHWPSPSLHGD